MTYAKMLKVLLKLMMQLLRGVIKKHAVFFAFLLKATTTYKTWKSLKAVYEDKSIHNRCRLLSTLVAPKVNMINSITECVRVNESTRSNVRPSKRYWLWIISSTDASWTTWEVYTCMVGIREYQRSINDWLGKSKPASSRWGQSMRRSKCFIAEFLLLRYFYYTVLYLESIKKLFRETKVNREDFFLSVRGRIKLATAHTTHVNSRPVIYGDGAKFFSSREEPWWRMNFRFRSFNIYKL